MRRSRAGTADAALRLGRLPFSLVMPRMSRVTRGSSRSSGTFAHAVARADRRAGGAEAKHRQAGLGPGGQIERHDAGIAGQWVQAVALEPAQAEP